MTFNQLLVECENLTDDALLTKYQRLLEVLATYTEADEIDAILSHMNLDILEDMDFFGTEGMNL